MKNKKKKEERKKKVKKERATKRRSERATKSFWVLDCLFRFANLIALLRAIIKKVVEKRSTYIWKKEEEEGNAGFV